MIEVVEMSACEINPAPISIPHNLPTTPRDSRGQWFLSAVSTDTEFVFVHSTRIKKIIKTAADGWTAADAASFACTLNRMYS